MTYPIVFKPNTTADVYNGSNVKITPAARLQLFKPLLNYRTNQMTSDFYQFNLAGAILQRFVVESAALGAMLLGPGSWDANGFPYLVNLSDAAGNIWQIMDGMTWPQTTGPLLVSGYAAKRRPPVTSRTPRALAAGAAAPAINAPMLQPGVLYQRTFPATEATWFLLDHPMGINIFWRVYAVGGEGGGPLRMQALSGRPGKGVVVVDSVNDEQCSVTNVQAMIGTVLHVQLWNQHATLPITAAFAFETGISSGQE